MHSQVAASGALEALKALPMENAMTVLEKVLESRQEHLPDKSLLLWFIIKNNQYPQFYILPLIFESFFLIITIILIPDWIQSLLYPGWSSFWITLIMSLNLELWWWTGWIWNHHLEAQLMVKLKKSWKTTISKWLLETDWGNVDLLWTFQLPLHLTNARCVLHLIYFLS